MLVESKVKPNKIWIDKGSDFYNRSLQPWLKDSGLKIYSMHNEGKSVIVERFLRTLKNGIYKHMPSISKNVYIDKSDEIVNEYNKTYHSAVKTKHVDVKDKTCIHFY